MYNNAFELLKIAKSENKRVWEVAVMAQEKLTDTTKDEIFSAFQYRLDTMKASVYKALDNKLSTKGGLIDGVAICQNAYSKTDNTVSGSFINYVMALAYSASEVNASMGKICACPTAGSCGVLPAVLVGVMEDKKIDNDTVLKALITASSVGAIFTQNATVAGADGGCQAECGVAASMAAAAAVFMMGGDDKTAFDAAGFAMINVMGLVCDPVAGLVQIPCAQRNASGAVNALISADMALAGQMALIPFDEVVDAMYKVGKMLPPQLRETAKGGIADTPTGRKIFKDIFGE